MGATGRATGQCWLAVHVQVLKLLPDVEIIPVAVLPGQLSLERTRLHSKDPTDNNQSQTAGSSGN